MKNIQPNILNGLAERLVSVHFISGLLSLGIGLVILLQARDFSRMGSYMPNLVGWLLIGLGVVLCIVQLLALFRIADPERVEGGIHRKLVFIGLMGLWVAVIPVLGFLTSAIIGFVVLLFIVPRKHWRFSALAMEIFMGILAIVAIFFLSTSFLDLAFPRGIFI